jgi:hypothetical protein
MDFRFLKLEVVGVECTPITTHGKVFSAQMKLPKRKEKGRRFVIGGHVISRKVQRDPEE